MKKLLLIVILLLAGCSGGSTPTVVLPELPPTTVQLYTYSIDIIGETKFYSGLCIETDKLYCYPSSITNDGFTVATTIDGNDVVIHNYAARVLVARFDASTSNIYTLTVTPLGAVKKRDLDGAWEALPQLLGEPIIDINFTGNTMTGTDTKGCYYEGEASELDNIYVFDVTITLCDDAGEYTGAIHTPQDKLRGLVTNGDKAILLAFIR